MKLGLKDRCPVHRRFDCCGRKERRKPAVSRRWVKIGRGVFKIDDPHHPRGYRIRRSKSAMTRLLSKKVQDQQGLCCICNEPFISAADITPDHIDPRGAGGAWRDDHEDNIGAAHSWCNCEKGSKRNARTPPQTEEHEVVQEKAAGAEGGNGSGDAPGGQRGLEGAGPADR